MLNSVDERANVSSFELSRYLSEEVRTYAVGCVKISRAV